MTSTYSDFSPFVSGLVDNHVRQWQSVSASSFEIGTRVDLRRKRSNEKFCRRTLRVLEQHLLAYPRAVDRQSSWREAAFDMLQQFARVCLEYTDAEQALLFDPKYKQATCDFVAQSKAFEPQIKIEDTFQALRNVWIMNSVQMLMGLPVHLTRSVFSYSMLYPCTDNVLDDPNRTTQVKELFNDWVEHRIRGDSDVRFGAEAPMDCGTAHLGLLFDLIEREHPRHERPNVLHSVMAIQLAQRNAMLQQTARLSQREILQISFEKGGTSVLAHGYLVNGSITNEQAKFLFAYGVFLQLLDDLQDLRIDLEAGHQTLFSWAATRAEAIDETLWKLLLFMKQTLARIDCFGGAVTQSLRDVIWRNCLLLVLTAVAQQHELFSRQLVNQLEAFSPLSFRAIRELDATVRQRYTHLGRKLVNAKKAPSVWNLLGTASPDLWCLAPKCHREGPSTA